MNCLFMLLSHLSIELLIFSLLKKFFLHYKKFCKFYFQNFAFQIYCYLLMMMFKVFLYPKSGKNLLHGIILAKAYTNVH